MDSGASHPVPEPRGAGAILAGTTQVLLALGVVMEVVSLGSSVAQYALLGRIAQGEVLPPGATDANDVREGLIGFVEIGLFVVTAVVFLTWLYRAHRNLAALRSAPSRFSSGQAVWAWFIPFLNLVRPYQVVRELWSLSAAGSGVGGKRMPELLGVWWTAWILCNVSGQVTFRWALRAEGVESFQTLTLASMVDDTLTGAAAIFALLVVRGIARCQQDRFQRVLRGTLPPPSEEVGGEGATPLEGIADEDARREAELERELAAMR